MTMTKLGGMNEIGTALTIHGLCAYIGTNLGNIYRMVLSTGAMTLLDSVGEKVVSMSVNHPTLYVATTRGNIYTYSITVTDDPYAATSIGAFSNAAGSGVELERSGTNTAAYRVYSDDGGDALYGSGSVPDIRGFLSRTLLTVDQSGGNIRVHALMGQIKAYDALWNGEVVSAVHGRLEIERSAATLTLGGYGISAAVLGVAATTGAVTVNTYHILAGVAAVADFKATLTQTGKTAAFLAANYDTTNWSDSTARTGWGYALYVKNAGVALGFISGTAYEAGVKVASVTTVATDGTTTWDGVMKIEIAGTAHYVPFMAAGHISGE